MSLPFRPACLGEGPRVKPKPAMGAASHDFWKEPPPSGSHRWHRGDLQIDRVKAPPAGVAALAPPMPQPSHVTSARAHLSMRLTHEPAPLPSRPHRQLGPEEKERQARVWHLCVWWALTSHGNDLGEVSADSFRFSTWQGPCSAHTCPRQQAGASAAQGLCHPGSPELRRVTLRPRALDVKAQVKLKLPSDFWGLNISLAISKLCDFRQVS